MSSKKAIGSALSILGGISMILVSQLAGHSDSTIAVILILDSITCFGVGLQF
ncbi:hypothetical protein [Lactiplantibacillus plantarum]|jgi:hypothetical protein|uniref:hypothetical protein n=1 Tax=Lactiplantibacillus plantarum TaxID=1590 RepID=UPI000CBD1B77|nr:hypothetical protein [Lactiplantibacillus plantarum]PME02954.1 hypothetical protein S101520_00096 [Lactiplantibacillus plantarum subsp. plantarum]WRM17379.1 hypothetical protein T1K45_14980 [Lactiplantibacillus plantarum]DAV14462.1 MAG TPA: hypothetical protein [Caudoviricetes sp.]